MFFNYIKTAIRNIKKDIFYTSLNILGLSVGIFSAIMILLYINDEISFDKNNSKYDRIHRLEIHFEIKETIDDFALTQHPLGPTLKDEFPQIEEYSRVRRANKSNYIYEDLEFQEENIYLADSSYFKIFDYEFISGNPETALNKPTTMVVTESFARRYFGNKDPMGKMIKSEVGGNFEITGVVKDLPDNVHVRPDAIGSYLSLKNFFGEAQFESRQALEYWRVSTYTYVLMKEGEKISSVIGNWGKIYDKYMKPLEQAVGGGDTKLMATRLNEVHHNPQKLQWDLQKSNFNYVYILGVIGLFLVIIAGINYMNLATARSSKRSKEVAIRKVSGSSKGALITQFLTESVIISLIAGMISIAGAIFALPWFNDIAGKNISFNVFLDPLFLLIILLLVVLIGLISGSYPAFFLSSFEPAKILKGELKNTVKSGVLRKVLVVAQFTMAVFMITGTLLITDQLDYMRNKPIGFDKENLMTVSVVDTTFRNKFESVRDELLKNEDIIEIGTAMNGPGSNTGKQLFKREGSKEGEWVEQTINFIYGDYNYVDALGFELIKGRKFDPKLKTDQQQAVLVNEAAIEYFGWSDDPIGKIITQISLDPNFKPPKWKVVGILKDFNYGSLHNPVEPLAIFANENTFPEIFIRIADRNVPQTIDNIEAKFREFGYTKPFNFTFMNETLDEFYKAEQKLSLIFSIFSAIAIFIACIGLLGLSAFIAEQKTKEIGVRKTLGATSVDIIIQLSKGFVYLVLIGILISLPLVWNYINYWLQDFAYKMDISLIPFLIAPLIAVFVAFGTIAFQAYKASLADPVKSLRYE